MTDLPNIQPDSRAATVLEAPDRKVSVRDLFGIDSDMEVPAFSEADERVPDGHLVEMRERVKQR